MSGYGLVKKISCEDGCMKNAILQGSIQKSETLPLKLQSPPESAVERLTGSHFGPPCSPVLGFISPSNSGFI